MKLLSLFLVLCCLTACSAHQQFDCPYKEGPRCLSVGEIDKRINAGQIGQDKTTASSSKKLEPALDNHSPSSLRTAETVLKLWIAPYYTSDGAYHEDQIVHFVAREASWINANLEIKGEEL